MKALKKLNAYQLAGAVFLLAAMVLLFSGFGSASSVPFLVLGLTFLVLGNDEKKKAGS